MISKKGRRTLTAYAFMAPALVLLIIFTIVPIIGSMILMFFDYSVLGTTKFIGFDNFINAFSDREFLISIKNSILFVAVVPVIQILSILLALLVNRKLPGMGTFRTLYYIPVVTSMVAVSIMWGFIFDPSGIINTFLIDNKIISQPLGFLNSKTTSMLCLMFITLWQGLGYYMMMYLAGLQGIPSELSEAAQIDGANAWQRFINVTIPSISPIIFYNVLTALITHLQVINPALALTDGGPGKKSMFMSYVIYLYGFQKNKMGYAAAYSVIFFLLVGVFTVILFTTQKNQVFGEGE